jgi:hypothetical protein
MLCQMNAKNSTRLKLFTLLFGFALSFFASEAQSANICTMTFNSTNEKRAFEAHYTKNGNDFYELVPAKPTADWFERACNSGRKCDLLLLSGHFGETYFGKSNATLDMQKIEDATCRSECGNILSAPTYDFSCSNLAIKGNGGGNVSDEIRRYMDYGFPRDLAEKVGAYRYTEYGLDLLKNTAIAFHRSPSFHGFVEGAPLGVMAGPLVEQALAGDPARSFDDRMTEAFAGTSYRTIVPKNEITDDEFNLSCQARSLDPQVQQTAFAKIFSLPSMTNYYDLILRNVDSPPLLSAWKSLTTTPSAVKNLLDSASKILDSSPMFVDLRFQTLKLQKTLGLMTKADYLSATTDMLNARLKTGMNYAILDQVCSVAKAEPKLVFQANWLPTSDADTQSYFARLASCFQNVPAAAEVTLKNWALTSPEGSLHREALRAETGKWSDDEKNNLLAAAKSWPERDLIEGYASAETPTPFSTASGWKKSYTACAKHASYAGSAKARDTARWNCFTPKLKAIKNLASCQTAAAVFETPIGLGVEWKCLHKFPNEISLTACLNTVSRHPHDAQSDDFLGGCWEMLKNQPDINASECHGFMTSMKDEGHRIKQNWNCTHIGS